MNEREYAEQAKRRIDAQEVADAKRVAERAKKRLALAGDQIVALRPLIEQAAANVTDPTLATALGNGVTSIDHTLTGIGRENDIP